MPCIGFYWFFVWFSRYCIYLSDIRLCGFWRRLCLFWQSLGYSQTIPQFAVGKTSDILAGRQKLYNFLKDSRIELNIEKLSRIESVPNANVFFAYPRKREHIRLNVLNAANISMWKYKTRQNARRSAGFLYAFRLFALLPSHIGNKRMIYGNQQKYNPAGMP